MGLTTVAQAVAGWFTPGDVEYLSAIYPHPPKLIPEQDWFNASIQFPSMTGNGAVIYIHIDARRQKRIAIGGAGNGRKWAQQQVTLLCYFRSTLERSEEAGAVNYDFLDSLETRLLNGRHLGTAPPPGTDIPPGTIFQAGEGSDTGGDDIEIQPGIPVTLNGEIVQVFSTFRFQVVEVLNT